MNTRLVPIPQRRITRTDQKTRPNMDIVAVFTLINQPSSAGLPMKTARLYQCARCQRQVVICSDCDRGNIYCSQDCSRHARLAFHRKSNHAYQKKPAGKIKHAKRQQRYRQRQKSKVTDGGSSATPPHGLLAAPQEQIKQVLQKPCHCHFCGKAVSNYLRLETILRKPVLILGTPVILKKEGKTNDYF